MTNYVRSYFQSKYFLRRGLGRNIYVEVETSWKRFPEFFSLFLNRFNLMSDIKLLQPCACVENFHRNWRIISCPITRLS